MATIGVVTSNADLARASDGSGLVAARPGISPLRIHPDYRVDARLMQMIIEVDEALGTARATSRRDLFGIFPNFFPRTNPGRRRFLNATFTQGDEPSFGWSVNDFDRKAVEQAIREADRMADIVVVQLHSHEGPSGDWNCEEIPDFLVDVAHGFVDAGADVVIGHGPHRLRPVEVYRGKPIFYSLGNFIFMLETIGVLPPEFYEEQGFTKPASPADVHDLWTKSTDGRANGFRTDSCYWESVLVTCTVESNGSLSSQLDPLALGFELPRSQAGVPRFTDITEGKRILSDLARASAERFDTRIEISEHAGTVKALLSP